MSDRRRNSFILIAVVGLIAASAVVIALMPTRLGLDLKGGVELVYQAKPTPQQPTIDAEAMDRSLDILRQRVDKLGVAEPEIQRSGQDQINVSLPDVRNAARAIDQVGKTAQLFFYDWEPNVIGPSGRPDPTNQQITQAPVPELYDAVLLASRRTPQSDGDNTTNDQYYLFSRPGAQGERRLLVGPEDSREDLVSELPTGRAPPGSQVLMVPTGTIVIRGERPSLRSRVSRRPRTSTGAGSCSTTTPRWAAPTSRTPSRTSTRPRAAPASRSSPSTSAPAASANSRTSPGASPSAA